MNQLTSALFISQQTEKVKVKPFNSSFIPSVRLNSIQFDSFIRGNLFSPFFQVCIHHITSHHHSQQRNANTFKPTPIILTSIAPNYNDNDNFEIGSWWIWWSIMTMNTLIKTNALLPYYFAYSHGWRWVLYWSASCFALHH